ncbi:MAG: STAS domain-containing protein [Schwartzia sp.]|nr:STAS domain-containing protein [Schwartzia sp. (in: firmicutes)]
MEIKREQNGNALTLHLIGRLAVKEAKELDQVVKSELAGITDLTFDLAELSYIASAGLRVLLIAQDMMDEAGGAMRLVHVNATVFGVLQMTGFSEFMTIEE